MAELITTVCSADGYQYYIPLFVLSAKVAYPEVHVRVFVKGSLRPDVKKALQILRSSTEINQDWEISENKFLNFPNTQYICSILRLILPEKFLKRFSLAYITDVDFLIFRQSPTHFEYYNKIMRKTRQPYAAFRSAIRRPWRSQISPKGWCDEYTRVVAGTLMIYPKKWLKKTLQIGAYYRNKIKHGNHDGHDKHRPGSYREQDEVYLYRMIYGSGLRVPEKKWYFVGNKRFNIAYRDIHLGDFKKTKRYRSSTKMNGLLAGKNIKAYRKLRGNPLWGHVYQICKVNRGLRQTLRHLDKYAKAK